MKKWNAPEVAELNITETANGLWDHYLEICIVMNDSKKSDKNETPDDFSK